MALPVSEKRLSEYVPDGDHLKGKHGKRHEGRQQDNRRIVQGNELVAYSFQFLRFR